LYQKPNDEDHKGVCDLEISLRKFASEPSKGKLLSIKSRHLDRNQKCLEKLFELPEAVRTSQTDTCIKIPPFSNVSVTAYLLDLKARESLCRGDNITAKKSILSLLSIISILNKDANIVDQYSKTNIRNTTANNIELAFSITDFQDNELLELQKNFSDTEAKSSLGLGFIKERCELPNLFKNYPEKQKFKKIAGIFDLQPDDDIGKMIYKLYDASGLEKLDLIYSLNHYRKYVKICELPIDKQFDAIQELPEEHPFYALFFVWLKHDRYSWIIQYYLVSTARLRLTAAAIAVERYKLKYGKLPDKLKQLVPEFINKIPTDPFTLLIPRFKDEPSNDSWIGRPVKYKKTGKHYIIYSIGTNQFDDGGIEKYRFHTDLDILFTTKPRKLPEKYSKPCKMHH
jgi:hypothetical protein